MVIQEPKRPRNPKRSWKAAGAIACLGLLIAGLALSAAPPVDRLPGTRQADKISTMMQADCASPEAGDLNEPTAAPSEGAQAGPAPARARVAGIFGFDLRPGAAADGGTIPGILIPEYEWLAEAQTSSGAFALAPGHDSIIPYFGNYAAMVMVRWDVPATRRYLEWYLGHLNAQDRFGLSGTVYDYTLHGDEEVSTRNYDSADSYAATFLTAVSRYFFATGDASFVVANLDRINLVAGVCLQLQDPVDGLVWAKPDHRYKFLMDNSEVQLGLDLWAETLRTLGYWAESKSYAAAASRIREAIEGELWLESSGTYSWGKTAFAVKAERRRWYPDTVCQLYPALFGVIDPQSHRAQDLLRQVNHKYPGWPELDRGDSFPWALAAYGALMGGDDSRALRFVETTWSRYITTGRPWPWYIMEATFYIQIVSELSEPGSSLPVRR